MWGDFYPNTKNWKVFTCFVCFIVFKGCGVLELLFLVFISIPPIELLVFLSFYVLKFVFLVCLLVEQVDSLINFFSFTFQLNYFPRFLVCSPLKMKIPQLIVICNGAFFLSVEIIRFILKWYLFRTNIYR